MESFDKNVSTLAGVINKMASSGGGNASKVELEYALRNVLSELVVETVNTNTWISTNGANLINHLSATGNVHSVTHAQTNGIQGGTTNEHYHLTATDYTDKNTNRRFGSVAGGNYAEFEADGTLVFIGTATYWKDIDFPVIIRTSGGNIPPVVTFVGNITLPAFRVNDHAVLESKELPHEWKQGGDMYFHMHVAVNGSDTTNRYIKYEIEYVISNINSAFPGTSTVVTSAELLIPANTATRTHLLFSIATVTMTGYTIGSKVCVRLRRVAATGTAPTNDPWLLEFQAHIECDTLGSRQISTK